MNIEEQWKEEAQISLEKIENAIEVEIAHDYILGYVEGRKKSQSLLRDNEALVRLICSVASDTITDVESLSMETIPEIVGRLKEIINLTLKYK